VSGEIHFIDDGRSISKCFAFFISINNKVIADFIKLARNLIGLKQQRQENNDV